MGPRKDFGNKYFSGNSICGLKGDHPFALATPRAAGWGSAQLNQIWKYMMRNICLVNKHSWENEPCKPDQDIFHPLTLNNNMTFATPANLSLTLLRVEFTII